VEALGILEKKLASLVDLAKKLKEENQDLREKNCLLSEENLQLHEKLDFLESASVNKSDMLNQEKEITKMVVDGLIKNIDSLIESESM
jgi:hypothetical protein